MKSDSVASGWTWLDDPGQAQITQDETDLRRAFARCFSGSDGQHVRQYLRRLFLDRRILPSGSDSQLWHLEGQRHAIAHILSMIDRGTH